MSDATLETEPNLGQEHLPPLPLPSLAPPPLLFPLICSPPGPSAAREQYTLTVYDIQNQFIGVSQHTMPCKLVLCVRIPLSLLPSSSPFSSPSPSPSPFSSPSPSPSPSLSPLSLSLSLSLSLYLSLYLSLSLPLPSNPPSPPSPPQPAPSHLPAMFWVWSRSGVWSMY